MNVRLFVLPALLAPALVLAQVDGWSTFPSDNTKPATTAAPAPAVKKEAAPEAKKEAPQKKEKKNDGAPAPQTVPATAAAPAPAAAPSTDRAPGAVAAPASSALAAQPAAPAPVTDAPSPSADSSAADDAAVVSQTEHFLPGTEPHSPSTLHNDWNALSNKRPTPNAVGSAGLLHTSSAFIGPRGLLKFSVLGEYLNQPNFPVKTATNVRTAGTFAASFAPYDWLETFVAYAVSNNTNSFSRPALIQALGDVTLGAKASKEWTKGFAAGLELRLQSFSGVGNQDVSHYAWGISPRADFSYDVRQRAPNVPLIAHANLGFAFDSTGSLVQQHQLNASEEFALGTNRFNRFLAAVAVEAPLPVVTPYLEWELGVPMGVPGGRLDSPDGSTVPVSAAMPHRIGVGAKITAVKDLTLQVGADFGLARTVGLGVPATPPYNLFFGAAFNIDPFQRGETRVVETLRERKVEAAVAKAPETGNVEGVVVDAQTKKPIPGVIVAMVGADMPPVASGEESGRFLTQDLKPGTVTLKAVKDGYQEAALQVVLAAGKTARVQLALEPKAKLAHFVVTVTSSGKKKVPLAAEVKLKGPVEKALTTVAEAKEASTLDAPPGKYTVTVLAEDYLAQTRDVQVSENADMKLEFALDKRPKKKLVVVKQDKIEILQQVHFVSGKAKILADSYSLLNQVVDAIVKNDVKKLRVEGHTDNRGGKKRNKKLSEDRAAAVAEYLVKQGIDPARIETAGFGDSRPIAPNLTARGREMNRRVEFVILER